MALDYIEIVDALDKASTYTLPELVNDSIVIVTNGTTRAEITGIEAKTQDGVSYVEITVKES